METDNLQWGVYDTKDKCWMGADNAEGPLIHEGEVRGASARTRARAAATIINEQFGEHIRFRARLIPKGVNKFRDRIEAKHTAVEAMKRLKV